MSLQALDETFFVLINSKLATPLTDILMPALTNKGYLLILPYLALLLHKAHKTSAGLVKCYIATLLLAGVAIALSDTTGMLLKNLIQRPRPCLTLDTHLLVGCSSSGSMPSNHSANAFAYAVTLALFARELKKHYLLIIYPLCLAVLVAVSRVFVGVHYPSDVIVGALIGSIYALILHTLLVLYAKRLLQAGHALNETKTV